MVVILLAIWTTALQVCVGEWNGIDPCKDEIDCANDKWNISVSNPENCGEYFFCIEKSLYPQQCPAGLQFDQNRLECTSSALCLAPCPIDETGYKDHIVRRSTNAATNSDTLSTSYSSKPNSTSSLSSTADTMTSRQKSLSSSENSRSSVTRTSTTSLPTTTSSALSPSARHSSSLSSTSKFTTGLATSIATSSSSFKSHTPDSTSSISTRLLNTVHSDAPTTKATSAVVSSTIKTSYSSSETTSWTSTTASFTTTKPIETTARQNTTLKMTPIVSIGPTTTTKTPSVASITTDSVASSSSSPSFSSSLSSQSSSSSSSTSSWSSPLSSSTSLSSPSTAAVTTSTITATTINHTPISSTTRQNQTTATKQSASSRQVTTASRTSVTTISKPVTTDQSPVIGQTIGLTTSSAPTTSTAVYTRQITTGKTTNSESSTSSNASTRHLLSTGGTSKWMTSVTSSSLSFTTSSTEDERTMTTAFQPDPSKLCHRPLPCTVGDRFGDVVDCRKYFECVSLLGAKNYWYSVGCPNGRLFDPIRQQCTTDNNYGYCLEHICSPKFDHVLEMTSSSALSNRPLWFLCSFRVVFVVQPVPVKGIFWLLNGYAVTSSESGQRIQVEPLVNVDQEFFSSKLSFNPASTTDSGVIECIAEYGNGETSRRTESFRVFPTPNVDLYPLNEVVVRNESVTLSCRAYYDDPSLGYSINGNNSDPVFNELRIVWYKENQKISFTNDSDCKVNGSFNDSVLICQPQNDTSYFCRTNFSFGFTDSKSSSIKVVQDNAFICKSVVTDDVTWPRTLAETTSMVSCKPSSVGFVTRRCSVSAGWEEPNNDGCIDKQLVKLLSQARDVRQGISINSSNTTESIAKTLRSFLSNFDADLSFGNFHTSLTILQELGSIHFTAWNITKPSSTEVKSALWSVSWLLNSTNDQQWRKVITRDKYGAVPVMDLVNIYGKKWAKGFSPGMTKVMTFDYLAISITCNYQNEIQSMSFPEKSFSASETSNSDWLRSSKDNIFFRNPPEFQKADGKLIYYLSSSYFRNLDRYLPSTGPDSINSSNITLGSRIISLTVDGLPSSNNLSTAVRIILETTETSGVNLTPNCVFWNPNSKLSGSWSGTGCRRVPSDTSKWTVCECDHLTNFAILFSPSTPGIHDVIPSFIGCVISIVSLSLTLLLFAVRWKKIHSHNIVVLINLCIALIIANIIFLVGINETTVKVGCTVIAALLHYFLLSAFFMILIEGIQLLLYTSCPFHVHRKRETTLLLLSAWVLPMILVGISLGVTKTEGYGGSNTSCLSLNNGLLWAFVGPALGVILINCVILVIVLVNTARTKRASEQTRKQRTWATAWNVFIITPVLGVTWVFGVFSVNEDFVVFQYIFAIFNSLQGCFILVFHGLCHRKSGSRSKKTSSLNLQSEVQAQVQLQSSTRLTSRNKMARIVNRKRQAINWVAIAAVAAAASSGDQIEMREYDDDSVSGGGRNSGHEDGEETFSRSLRASANNSIRSGSQNTTSTDRTDLLF